MPRLLIRTGQQVELHWVVSLHLCLECRTELVALVGQLTPRLLRLVLTSTTMWHHRQALTNVDNGFISRWADCHRWVRFRWRSACPTPTDSRLSFNRKSMVTNRPWLQMSTTMSWSWIRPLRTNLWLLWSKSRREVNKSHRICKARTQIVYAAWICNQTWRVKDPRWTQFSQRLHCRRALQSYRRQVARRVKIRPFSSITTLVDALVAKFHLSRRRKDQWWS